MPFLDIDINNKPPALRVLFVGHDSTLYGAQLALLTLLASLDRSIVEPFVVVPNEGPFIGEVEKIGVPIYRRYMIHWVVTGARLNCNYWTNLIEVVSGLRARAWAIARLIEKNQIDLVYSNTVTVIEGAIAARMCHVPHVWHLHENVVGNPALRPVLPRSVLTHIVSALSDRIIVPSRYLMHEYRAGGILSKTMVVPNGVVFEQSQLLNEETLNDELSIPSTAPVITLIGAIHPGKDIRTFVAAAASVLPHYPNTVFLVVGEVSDARYATQIQTDIAARGIEYAFRFLGWRSDIPQLLRHTDILVVSSIQETFGRTIIEAMAAGIPVVATRCGGPEEVVVDGVTGYLVPITDPGAMAKSILRILADASLRQAFSKAGQQRVKDVYSQSQVARQTENLLMKVAGRVPRQS